MNWWANTDVLPGVEEAIRSAQTKLSTGKSLDFDLKPIFEAAQNREKEEKNK
ncbi:MAG TPA: hypothetical protein PLI09_26150 [Candidatus Hydrogenedentes bacterium]|nr:hypothetical protein [Candidatus Hydrogenedentota bacterium]